MNDEFNPKTKTEEDWLMSDPNQNLPPNQTLLQPIEDWSMTGKLVPPKSDGTNNWKMPEPKFQATSGSLPKDFVKDSPDFADLETQPLSLDEIPDHSAFVKEIKQEEILPPPTENSEATFDQPPSTSPIEPQPDIAEAFASAEVHIEPPPEEKQRSKTLRIFLAVLGLSAMLIFAVAFLVVVYFLFFYNTVAE